jgi:hypothetical protein
MEVNAEPFSRSVVVDSRCAAYLSSGLCSPAGVALYSCNAFDAHPFSLLHEVLDGGWAWVA